MLDAFTRASQSILRLLGQDAFLRGEGPYRINIEHGVQVVGDDNQFVGDRSVATIPDSLAPKTGDTLQHPDGTYRLDGIYQRNGVNTRFVLLKVLP